MQIRKIETAYIILILLISPVLMMSGSSEENLPPVWNEEWLYRQEIELPISTNNPFSI